MFASNERGALHREIVGTRLRMASRHIGEAVAHGGEVPGQVPRGAVALLWILGKTAFHDPKERSRSLQQSGAKPLRLIAKDGGRGFRMGLFLERGTPGDHFVEH